MHAFARRSLSTVLPRFQMPLSIGGQTHQIASRRSAWSQVLRAFPRAGRQAELRGRLIFK